MRRVRDPATRPRQVAEVITREPEMEPEREPSEPDQDVQETKPKKISGHF